MGGSAPGIRGLHHIVRNALIVSAFILLALGGVLTLFPRDTDRLFSWTIDVGLTVGTLGSYYLAALALVLLTLSGGMTWARARVMLAGAVAFSALALLATLMHLDRFHFDSTGFALVITWVWTVAYAILPPLMLIGLWPQRRVPGADPLSERAAAWIPRVMAAFGAILLVVGTVLFVVPEDVAEVWPWALTALTGRVLGAWTIGLGLALAFAARERHRFPLVPASATLGLFGLFQLVTVLRFGGDMEWGGPAAWVYVAFLVAALLVGAAAWAAVRPVAEVTRAAEPVFRP
jgi:hypothetical protein